MQLFHAGALSIALLPAIGGCYAALGPTIGVDLPTGRPTVGVEGSAETFTFAHSVALGARSARDAQGKLNSRNWSSHSYVLWEPGAGGVLDAQTDGKFSWLGGGASVGVRVNRYEDAPMDGDVVLGAWTSAGHALMSNERRGCGADDTRPFAALVVGIRGLELYASPKVGVLHVPGVCLNFLADGSSF